MKSDDASSSASSVPLISKKKRQQSSLTRCYLIAYNGAQLLGWSYILVKTLNHLGTRGLNDSEGLWNQNHLAVKIFQSAMALEIIHAATGIVPSGIVNTAIQIFSRVLVVWGIGHAVPESRGSYGVPLCMMTWGITECLRYSYYLGSLFDVRNRILQWCRYTFFVILYPSGVTGELLMMLAALPYISERNTLSYDMPNVFNWSFSFHRFILLNMALYVPFFPQLYLHMFSQRKKTLRGISGKLD